MTPNRHDAPDPETPCPVGNGADMYLHDAEEQMHRDAPPADALLPSTRLDAALPGNDLALPGYAITRELHRGGQGIVFQAVEKATKRKVAIKVLLEGRLASANARRRFEREIELAASLKHPNIVAVFHSGVTADGRQFCVMDYIRGMPLHNYVRETKPPLNTALKLFATVCDAVNYAHQKGVIHRDLKPSNILVDVEGVPRVLDFGLAKLVGGPEQTLVSMTGQLVGTLPYLSPEQARGNPDEIDTRTDVYTLGVVLYEMLTGCFPYPVVGQMADVLRHISETAPTPPSRRWKKDSGIAARGGSRKWRGGECPIDDEVQTIVLRALTKERQRRYQSAGELGRDIDRYLKNDPIEAKRDSALYVLRKSLRRYRRPLLVAGAFLLLVVTAGVVSMALYGRAVRAEVRERGLRQQAERDKTRAEVARDAESAALAGEAEAKRTAQRLQADAELQSYVANLAAASASLTANEPLTVRASLDSCAKSLRGWEWGALVAQADTSLAIVGKFKHVIAILAVSPDGNRLVTRSHDDSVCMLATDSGKELLTLPIRESDIRLVLFSPDGACILTATHDGVVQVWNSASGAEQALHKAHILFLSSPAFSADSALVTSVHNNGQVCIWNWKSDKCMQLNNPMVARHAALSPDSARLAVTNAGEIAVFDAATGAKLVRPRPSKAKIKSAIFNPAGTLLLTPCEDWTVRLWNASSGKSLSVLSGHANTVSSASFGPNGTRIVTGSSDSTVRTWETATGAQFGLHRGHLGDVPWAQFSLDGTTLISASRDGTVRRWDAHFRSEPRILQRGDQEPIPIASFAQDGQRLVCPSSDGLVRSWDALLGTELGVLCNLGDHPRTAHVNADGTRIVATYRSHAPCIFDVTTGKIVSILTGAYLVTSARFSPNGSHIVTTAQDGTCRIWDARMKDGPKNLPARARSWESPNFSADSQLVAIGNRGGATTVWDVTTGHSLLSLGDDRRHASCSAFSRDGGRIATGSWDGSAFISDAVSGRELLVLSGHNGFVTSVAFSPDGARLVTGSQDRTIRIWAATTGVQLALFRTDGMIHSVTFSPDGLRVMATLANKILVWDSIPYRIRVAERQARNRGEDSNAIVKTYIREATDGRESWASTQPVHDTKASSIKLDAR